MRLNGKRVLIVDDEPGIRNVLDFRMRRLGCEVEEAESGRTAIERLSHKSFDLILSDIRMPNGGGLELLRAVRARDPRKPPLIFISGFSDLSSEDAYNEGVHAVLVKPVDYELLQQVIETALTPEEELWTTLENPGEIASELRVDISGWTQALDQGVFGLGRGGAFISTSQSFPQVSELVRFHVGTTGQSTAEMEGFGVVRWIRHRETDFEFSGVGVEFVGLSPPSRQRVLAHLNQHKPVAFIPLGLKK